MNSNDFLKELANEFGLEYVQLSPFAAFLYYPNFYEVWLVSNFGSGSYKISINCLDKVNISYDYRPEIVDGGCVEFNVWASAAIRQRLIHTVKQVRDVIEAIKKAKIRDKIKDLEKDFEK
jgi:hypothetical protein